MSRSKDRRPIGENLTLRLDVRTRGLLRKLMVQRRRKTGRPVSRSTLIREAIDSLIARELVTPPESR